MAETCLVCYEDNKVVILQFSDSNVGVSNYYYVQNPVPLTLARTLHQDMILTDVAIRGTGTANYTNEIKEQVYCFSVMVRSISTQLPSDIMRVSRAFGHPYGTASSNDWVYVADCKCGFRWQAGYEIQISVPELDPNGTPVIDYEVWLKCLKI